MIELGAYLKQGRCDAGETQREAAIRAGVSNAYICQLETGATGARPSARVLAKLCKAYNLPFNRLLEMAGYPPLGERPIDTIMMAIEDLTDAECALVLAYLEVVKERRG